MPAHIGVLDTFGIELAEGAEAQSASQTETIEASELVGANGEIVKADPLFAKKIDVSVSFVGTPQHASIASGAVVDPSTIEVLESDATEQNKGRVACTATASGHEAFVDAAGTSPGTGAAGPDEDTLNLVSSTLTLAEQVNVKKSVQDKVLLNALGAPAVRQKHGKKNTFAVRWKGDPPANVALGTSGVGVFGCTGGKLLVLKKTQDEKNEEWNGGSAEGNHYPVAA